MTALQVTIDRSRYPVALGHAFTFGRDEGPGQVAAQDATVSRAHGIISNYADRWEVTSTGSFLGFLVHDVHSAATLEVPAGAGPLTVPFASVLIVIPARRRHVFAVEAPHVVAPEGSSASPHRNSGAMTEKVIPESSCYDRDGRPLRWFQVLIALCEHRLVVSEQPAAMAADAQIRQRLEMGASSFDRAFARAREELGFEPYAHMVRVAMVTTALHQGIVQPEHLALLPPR